MGAGNVTTKIKGQKVARVIARSTKGLCVRCSGYKDTKRAIRLLLGLVNSQALVM